MNYGRKRVNHPAFIPGLMMLIPILAVCAARYVKGVNFDQEVGGRLKRAADANSVSLARTELAAALQGMSERGLTKGKSHFLWYTPECDVKFWHDNIEAAHAELEAFPEDADALTTSNQLMKLRETLLDDSSDGVVVTLPPHIVTYPAVGVWNSAYIIFALVGAVGLIVCLERGTR